MPYGNLEVTVVEGKKLKESDFFDKTNPYVCLSLDKHNKQKTCAIQNAGSGATWNEKFNFDVLEGRYELYIEVLDDVSSNDDLIGGAAVPLYEVFQQGHVDNWFNITRPSGKPAGEIHLSMNFKNQGPTSGPPGHTPYPVPNGPGYFSPPNSGSNIFKSYSENQVQQVQQVQQEAFSSFGPEGGAIPSNYGSGAPPNVITPQLTGPPAYPTAGGGFPDPSSYVVNMPVPSQPPDYKPPTSDN
ncbi:unnamed protein product [Rhizophagus irregularis]|uniref:C2 domain-containing protein n=1 Tax=Rhizophagus irregularis TaxID=588596 RepID=A0A2I1GWZ2_9GLOM|nr:hypothetical protein RhiirA4_407167 [Rhizophagus irregularis]CAB4416486.1 unnamed protein product [Rhizophagus irregularis]CAB4417030.1 unnamed protein product [Rhizophagus irregularis]